MTPSSDRTLLGVLCMIGFCVFAPMMDALAKATPVEVPVLQILGARFGVQVAVLLPAVALLRLGHRPSRAELALHVLRGALLLVATGLFFTALRFMSIASALAIFFVEPFILTLLGWLVLREEVGRRRIIACAVGFGGALLVIQPKFAEMGAVALLPLGTALCFAFYVVLTRRLARAGHPMTLQAYTAAAVVAMVLPVLWLFDGSGRVALDPVWPQGLAVWTLLGVGLTATVSHLFLGFALKFASTASIAPLQYLEIVAATVLGYLMFGDFPDRLTWAGIAIIVGAGLYVFAREQRQGQVRATRPTPPV
jgi:drug/metabolite transporter (DMT)-like permease